VTFASRSRAAAEAARRRLALEDPVERWTLVAFLVLLVAAIGLRAWFTYAYRPALLGYGDSYSYLLSGARDLFRDAQRPAGYPLFLRLMSDVTDRLTLVIVVQHALGLATGVLLWRTVRRVGGPPWLGLVPAAVVFLGGNGLFLEHAVVTEALFTFLQACALYAAVRTMASGSVAWPLLAGAFAAADVGVRTVATSTVVLLIVWLLVAPPGTWRQRGRNAGLATLARAVVLGAYVVAQHESTGYTGLTRAGIWNLYGSVGPFADCSKFTPPKGTALLCPTDPVSQRKPPNFFVFGGSYSPAIRAFGSPQTASQGDNARISRFVRAVILHQPLDYASAILTRLESYVFPSGSGGGLTPESLRLNLLDRAEEGAVQPAVTLAFPHTNGYVRHQGAIDALSDYERETRVSGVPMIVLLLLGILAPFLLVLRTERAAAALFTLTALLSITFAVAGISYDPRFAAPTFGPLAAGAALGGWALFLRAAAATTRPAAAGSRR
jgi:hypothetical protein